MSTMVLEDVGASTPGTPLRLRFDDGGGTDVDFQVDDGGDLKIIPDGGGIELSANVGIGVAAGAEALTVAEADNGVVVTRFNNNASTAAGGIIIDYTASSPNNTGNNFVSCEDSTTLRLAVRSNGGLSNFQSNDTDLSDADLKEVYGVIDSTWAKIKQLDVVGYRYKENLGTRIMIGVTAQQVREVEPAWFENRRTIVTKRKDRRGRSLPDHVYEKPCMVFNKDILFSAVRALQEAMTRIEALEES